MKYCSEVLILGIHILTDSDRCIAVLSLQLRLRANYHVQVAEDQSLSTGHTQDFCARYCPGLHTLFGMRN